MESSGWFGVRCIFDLGNEGDSTERWYEERVTLWYADDAETAIALAEAEAKEYAEVLGLTFLGLSQSYNMADAPRPGTEVFSLRRRSSLRAGAYLNQFFDTGTESQDQWTPNGE